MYQTCLPFSNKSIGRIKSPVEAVKHDAYETLEVLKWALGISIWKFKFTLPESCQIEYRMEEWNRGADKPNVFFKSGGSEPFPPNGSILLATAPTFLKGGAFEKVFLISEMRGKEITSPTRIERSDPFQGMSQVVCTIGSTTFPLNEDIILLSMVGNKDGISAYSGLMASVKLEETVKSHDKTLVLWVRFSKRRE